jgi:hypothetical protein
MWAKPVEFDRVSRSFDGEVVYALIVLTFDLGDKG